ncbi:hypothetical protein [Aliikangiella maris]|uniref:CheW-like domain-containing protein n=2 Tax=Aliikangiella maris TaxID=3162458 RepID=A0ABV3MNG3_9GAMM
MMGESSKVSNAWLVEYRENDAIAFGIHALQEIVVNPRMINVPLSPQYCHKTLRWKQRMLPVCNLSNLAVNENVSCNQVMIVKYWLNKKAHYAGLECFKPPVFIQIYESRICPLASSIRLPHTIITRCFQYQKKSVPIIDLASLFTLQELNKNNNINQ